MYLVSPKHSLPIGKMSYLTTYKLSSELYVALFSSSFKHGVTCSYFLESYIEKCATCKKRLNFWTEIHFSDKLTIDIKQVSLLVDMNNWFNDL